LPEIGRAFGVEIEFASIPQQEVIEFVNSNFLRGTRVVNDASCHSSEYRLGNFIVPEESAWGERRTTGGEVVTTILEMDDNGAWMKPFNALLSFFRNNGEKPNSKTSIHFHFSFGNRDTIPVKVLHGLLELWKRIEDPIFRITQGEFGYSRGENHLDHLYCRPIVDRYGPHIILDYDEVYRPCFELNKLLKTTSTKEFFQSLCRSDSPSSHYWPPKYHALNLFSIVDKGTIEFRTPNVTLNPDFLYTWGIIFRRIVEKSYGSFVKPPVDMSRPVLPLGSKNNGFSYGDLIEILEIQDTRARKTIETLWNIGRWTEPMKGPIHSHLGYGIGGRMPAARPRFSGVRKDIVPESIPRLKKVFHPDDYLETPEAPMETEESRRDRRSVLPRTGSFAEEVSESIRLRASQTRIGNISTVIGYQSRSSTWGTVATSTGGE